MIEPPPTPRPATIQPKRGAWPFTPWSYAKAYTFNFFDDAYAQLQVVTEKGIWSSHIRSEQLLSQTEASSAAKLVKSIKGTFETTKCTFPRHSIVFFDQRDQPVSSVDVCFECEGILVWPDYTDKDENAYANAAFLKTFEGAIARFKVLFGKDLGQPIDYKTDLRPRP